MEIAEIDARPATTEVATKPTQPAKSTANAWPLIALAAGGISAAWIGSLEGSIVGTLVVACLLLGLGSSLLLWEKSFSRYAPDLIHQFWFSFGFRIFVTAILHAWLSNVFPLPLWNIGADGGDERDFYEISEHWMEAWNDGAILSEPFAKDEDDFAAWTYCMGFIRFVGLVAGGDTLFNAKLLTCFFGSLLVPYIYLLARHCFDEQTARRAFWLAFWLPDYWYLSGSLMRDVMISCIVVLTIYQAVAGIRDGFKLGRLTLVLLLALVVLHYLKIWLSEVLLALFALWWFIEKLGYSHRKLVMVAWAICLIGLPFIAMRVSQLPGAASLIAIGGDNIDLDERINTYRFAGLDEGSSSSLGKAILERGVFLSSPILVGQILLSIPPWSALANGVTPRGIAESFATWIWLGFVIFLPAGFLESFRQEKTRSTIWIWGTALSLLWLLAVSGTIVLRWRLMVMPLLIILVAVGMLNRNYRWTVKWAAGTVVALLLLYMFIKGSLGI